MSPRALAPLRILVVDDDPETVLAMSALLASKEHVVQGTSESGRALELAEAMDANAALLDVQMVGLNGLELAHRFRRHPALRNIKLIAVSGHTRPFDQRRALAAGFDAVLPKPIDVAALFELLDGGA